MGKKIKGFIKKYENISAPVKAALWFAICNVVQKGISMITVPIFTRILTAEQYGVYTVYQSWYSIIIIFASLNLFYGVFNNGMIKYPDKRDEFTSTMQGLTTTLTLIIFLVFVFAKDFWSNILELSPVLIFAMLLQILFSPAFSFWAARQRFEYKYQTLVWVTMLTALANPLLGILAVLNTSHKAEARVFSLVVVETVIGLFFYVKNARQGKRYFNKEFWKFALAFNIPLVPHYLAQSILQQSDRIMISNMVGKGEAAIYGVAYSVSTLMILVTSAINNSYIPYTYNCIKKEKFGELRKNTNTLLVLVGLGTFFVVAFGPEIIKIFAPVEYYSAIWIIPPVSASVYFMFLYPIFGNIEFYFEENKFVMLASVTGAVANVILNAIFIPKYGYFAAGYTTLFCYILFSGGHYLFMNKVIKNHIPGKKPYDIKFLTVFSCVVIVAMGIMSASYYNALVRYGMIIVMFALVWIKKSWIISVFKVIKK